MKVIELRDIDKRPQSSKRSIRPTSVRGGGDDGKKIKSRSSSSKAGGLPKDSNLYTNDSLDSSFLNKLVYDYKSNLDTVSNNKSTHLIEEGRTSRKSNKSLKIEENENLGPNEDENHSKRKSLMKVLTFSKSSSMTSMKERASFLESSNPTTPNDDQAKKDDAKSTKSGSQSPLFDKTQSYVTSIRMKTSENLSDIEFDNSKRRVQLKPSNFRKFQSKKRPEIKYQQFKPASKIDEKVNSAEKAKPKKALRNEDYNRSIARLAKSARKTQELSPTRFTTVHDNLNLDSQKLFELTKRLSKSKFFIYMNIGVIGNFKCCKAIWEILFF